VLELLLAAGKGGWIPKVSAKQVQRRIAALDAQYTVAQPEAPRWLHCPRDFAMKLFDYEKYNRRTDRLAYGVLLVTFAVAWIAARAGMPFWQIAIVFLMTGVGLYLIVEDNMRHGHD
jgi:hypothetical protein